VVNVVFLRLKGNVLQNALSASHGPIVDGNFSLKALVNVLFFLKLHGVFPFISSLNLLIPVIKLAPQLDAQLLLPKP
jgi:hypothetical protein